MELALLFYFADIIKGLSFTVGVLGGTILLIAAVVAFISADTGDYALTKRACKWMTLPVALFLFATLLPSKSGIYQMAAAYGVQSAASNPEVQRVAGKSLQVLEQSLDEYLKKDKGK